MRLLVTDQILVTGVRNTLLHPSEQVEVGDDLGRMLLKTHPKAFAVVDDANKEPAGSDAKSDQADVAGDAETAPMAKPRRGQKPAPKPEGEKNETL